MRDFYGLEEWELLKGSDDKGFKPTRIKIDLGAGDNEFLPELATLVNVVAAFCKCRSVWMCGSGWGLSDRPVSTRYVYGYESDLRYFELLPSSPQFVLALGADLPLPDSSTP